MTFSFIPFDRHLRRIERTYMLGGIPVFSVLLMVPALLFSSNSYANWNFEAGLAGWHGNGEFERFSQQTTAIRTDTAQIGMAYSRGGIGGDYWKNMPVDIGQSGEYWLSSFDITEGRIASPRFVVNQPFVDYLVGCGGAESSSCFGSRVELQLFRSNQWEILDSQRVSSTGETLYRQWFNLRGYEGQTLRLVFIDESTETHLNIDDIRFAHSLPEYLEVFNHGELRYMDLDAPVWGVAETHAHPSGHLGFGGKLVIGDSNAPLRETYSAKLDSESHDFFLDVFRTFMGEPHDAEGGWPYFYDYPSFSSKTHQKQHVDFIKRAWKGGLRLYVALAVNNMYAASLLLPSVKPGYPTDDEGVLHTQIEHVKKMVRSNSDWMQIAYSPKEARQIIHSGKLAVVLGVENDNFGNFIDSSYVSGWSSDPRFSVLNASNASNQIDKKLDEYHRLGIRQVTPLHYISGVFGGAAVFNTITAQTQFMFKDKLRVKSGLGEGIHYSLYQDQELTDNLLNIDFKNHLSRVGSSEEALYKSMVNADGLTIIGKDLMRSMMDRGMLIDSDHMSLESKDDLFQVSSAYNNYPIMSSHTDLAELNFKWKGAGEVKKFKRNKDIEVGENVNQENIDNYGTTQIENLPHEGQVASRHLREIAGSGGVISPILLPYRKDFSSDFDDIPEASGSSTTWAKVYLQSFEGMEGRGVALSSDTGMVDSIAPRFGPNSAYKLAQEAGGILRLPSVQDQRNSQVNGVRYDRAFTNVHTSTYNNSVSSNLVQSSWRTLIAITANNTSDLDRDCFGLLRGYQATRKSDLDDLRYGNPYDYQKALAMYYAKNNIQPTEFDNGKFFRDNEYVKVRQTLSQWDKIYGDNEPLRRLKSGHRDWDYNFDGLAHYGLLPDFFQDLSNIGLEPNDLSPLFNSAEHYLQMWEKADSLKALSRRPFGEPLQGKFSDSGLSNTFWYAPGSNADELWLRHSGGSVEKIKMDIKGDYRPVVGDFDGDGYSEIIWLEKALSRARYYSRFNRDGFVETTRIDIDMGLSEAIVGDFNGDGISDIFWYMPGQEEDILWLFDEDMKHRDMTFNVKGRYAPVVGDFNGDGVKDILWFKPEGGSHYIYLFNRFGGHTVGKMTRFGRNRVEVGHFNRDKRTDIHWQSLTGGRSALWFMRGSLGHDEIATEVDPLSKSIVGDYNGDTIDDIFWYHSGSIPDELWSMTGVGFKKNAFDIQSEKFPVPGMYDNNATTDLYFDYRDSVTDFTMLNAPVGPKGINLPPSIATQEDRIRVTISPANEGFVEMCLNMTNGITWWKGVEIKLPSMSYSLGLKGGVGMSCESIDSSNLGDDIVTLEFSKAKFLGVNTYLFSRDLTLSQYEGKRITLTWEID